MISTKNLVLLPDREKIQTITKAVSVLDAILSQDWEFRYYSYNRYWSEQEEFFEMRNGSGDHMLILFRKEGTVINGFGKEFDLRNKDHLTKDLLAVYNEFIFGEPVNSVGTTFCIWTDMENNWRVGQIENYNDNSAEMLKIFDANPQTYIDWASQYFEGYYNKSGIPLEIVCKIYEGKPLTRQMIYSIVEELEDWEQLENDLIEIGYPYNFT